MRADSWPMALAAGPWQVSSQYSAMIFDMAMVPTGSRLVMRCRHGVNAAHTTCHCRL